MPYDRVISIQQGISDLLSNLEAVIGFPSLIRHWHHWLAVSIASLHQLKEIVGASVLVNVLDAIPALWSPSRPFVLLLNKRLTLKNDLTCP